MVNIVKTIETTIKTDHRQMKFLKRQLKTNPSEIYKLRQSTLLPEGMIAPIHAAVLTENIEILQHILAMKDVYYDQVALVRTRGVGVISIAVHKNPKNLDILKLLLDHVQRPWIDMIECPELGMLLPGCLVSAMEDERLDILEVLLGKADMLEREVNPAYLASYYGEVKFFSMACCLAIAVGRANKPGLFSHLLLLPSFQVTDLYQALLPYKEKPVTLIEFARIHKRTEMLMCEQVEQILKDALTQEQNVQILKDALTQEQNRTEMLKKKKLELEQILKDTLTQAKDRECIADKLAHLLNSEKEKPCPKSKNSKMRQSKKIVASHENNNLEGDQCKEKNDKLEEETDAAASRVRKLKYCWNCENISKYTCSGCRKARYCEENCQWDDWESHKAYCLVRMNQIAFKEFEFLSASLFE